MNKRFIRHLMLAIVLIFGFAGHVSAAPPPNQDITDVRKFGAKGDGTSDDTFAFLKAISMTIPGGVVYVPPGSYVVSDTLEIAKPLRIEGAGLGSQIYQRTAGKQVFELNRVKGALLKDMYLGSQSSVAGTSLIRLINAHHNRIEGIIMLGGYYGVHLQGSLLNTFVALRSGINVGGFFMQGLPVNQSWVVSERFNSISSNANTFIAIALEGGTNGFWHTDKKPDGTPNAEGNLVVTGGTIEGVAGIGMHVEGSFLPIVVSGVHFESNGIRDIEVTQARNVKFDSIFAERGVLIGSGSGNVHIANSVVDDVMIVPGVTGTQLTSVTYNITGHGHITDNTTASYYQNVVKNSSGPVDWYNTIGIGILNPNSNPVGLTPNLKVQVNGTVKAGGYLP